MWESTVLNLISFYLHSALPSSSVFFLYFSYKQNVLQRKPFLFFSIPQLPRNHKSQSLQSAGNCVSLDPSFILYLILLIHSFTPPFFYSLLSNKVPWNSLHKVGRRHEDRDGAYDVEKAERHQTKTVDYGTCKFPLVGHAFGLILLPETVCHVAYLLQDSL